MSPRRLRYVFGFRLQPGQILVTGETIRSVRPTSPRLRSVWVETLLASYCCLADERVLVLG